MSFEPIMKGSMQQVNEPFFLDPAAFQSTKPSLISSILHEKSRQQTAGQEGRHRLRIGDDQAANAVYLDPADFQAKRPSLISSVLNRRPIDNRVQGQNSETPSPVFWIQRLNDNSTVSRNSDLSTCVADPDGYKMTILPDGSLILDDKQGDLSKIYPNGISSDPASITRRTEDGSWASHQPDGTQVCRDVSGIVTVYRNGFMARFLTDMAAVLIDRGGVQSYIYADGTLRARQKITPPCCEQEPGLAD